MSLRVVCTTECWPLRRPFVIARDTMHALPLLHVELIDDEGFRGLAEAAGVDYEGETPAAMAAQVHAVADALVQAHAAAPLGDTPTLGLPPGGARNAIDCAWWDLRAKRTGVPAWQRAGLTATRPLVTAVTIGLDTPDAQARQAEALRDWPLVKLKLGRDDAAAAVRAVRAAAPHARLVVDANEAWTRTALDAMLPVLAACEVELVEQPLPRGQDAALDGLAPPVPLCADESCTDRASLPTLVGRYQAVNVKLDKCGGLTEALALQHAATALGLDVLVGNMCGTSLGMAPAFLVAQRARWVDLDGPLLQQCDRSHAMQYDRGRVHPPPSALWG